MVSRESTRGFKQEVFARHFAVVCGSEYPPAWIYTLCSEVGETVIVLFDSEDFPFVASRESGRVENEPVELASLFHESAKPMEGVTFAKVVLHGVHSIVTEIGFRPVQIGLREIER